MPTVSLTAKIETEGAAKGTTELDKFAKSAEKTDAKVSGLSKELKELANKQFGSVGSGLASLASSFNRTAGVAIAAFSASMIAVAVKSAAAEDAIADLSEQSGIAVDRFKELSFAFKTVGLSQESLADTSRKVTNELGQFAQSGAGGFKAIFDALAGKVNLTADSLKNLSGAEVLQKVKTALDQANIPLQQQGFLLDGLARGTSKLIPLLADGGAKMEAAAAQYRKFNDEIKISGPQSAALGVVADQFDLLKTTMGNAATFFVSSFAPQLKSVIDWVLMNVPTATRTMTSFFQSFLDTKNKTDLDALQVELVKTESFVNKLSASVEEFQKTGKMKSGKVFGFSDFASADEINTVIGNYEKGMAKIAEIRAKMEAVKAQNKTPEIITPAASSSFENNDARQKALEDAMQNELDWYQSRLDAFNAFIEETDKLGKSEIDLINMNERKRLETLDSFRSDDVDGLERSEGAKKAIILQAEKERKALFDSQRKAGTDYLNQLATDGMTELQMIEERARQKFEKLREIQNAEGEIIWQNEEQKNARFQQFEDARTAISEQAAKEREQLTYAQNQLAIAAGAQLFGSLANLQKTFGKESGRAYKVLFGIQQGFLLAQAGLAIAAALPMSAVDPTAPTLTEKLTHAAVLGGAITSAIGQLASVASNPREQGGQFSAGQTMLVGERGAELVRFGSNGRIANHGDTKSMMSGGGNVTIINQTSGRIDKAEVQQQSNGDFIIIAKEVLNREAANPNSEFNRTLDRTRNAPRRVT